MARTAQRFEMGGKEVVLGLLIERPGTSYELDHRLRERFGSAQFGRGTAGQAVKRLAEMGLVLGAARSRVATSVDPAKRPKTTWSVNSAGVEYFQRWMRSSISTPPVREELHAKIALCKPADLPAMIELVREAERACQVKLQGLQWRIQDERQDARSQDWGERMGLLVRSGDVAWWGGRIKWLQDVRQFLEKERQRYEAERR